METVINILIGGAAFMIGASLLRGVDIKSFLFLDFTLGTLLKIVTLGILSLGVFTWFLNAILIQVADWFLPKFEVKNFWWALALAGIVSIAT